jgi:AraC-like DNA-binding protein
VHRALLVHTVYEALQVEYMELVLHLPLHDPLHRHIALVLQAERDAEGEAGHLYAQSLADALVVHFLRRYAAVQSSRREVAGGFTPFKLRRTFAYIQEHLEHELSLATLAAVAQTSPAHFARLFKQATGRTPHQYVVLCRMEQAKWLLAETDWPLIEIAHVVGCADQSHFTALFRQRRHQPEGLPRRHHQGMRATARGRPCPLGGRPGAGPLSLPSTRQSRSTLAGRFLRRLVRGVRSGSRVRSAPFLPCAPESRRFGRVDAWEAQTRMAFR